MVQKCYSCGSSKTDNVKLHGFPKDINLREKWVAQIKKDVPIIITQYTRLCSKHFTNYDYYQSSFGNDILKPDAVPSRFFCSRKSLLPEFEVRPSMSTDKPILTVNDNLENLMLEEEIVVNEDENNSAESLSDRPIVTIFDNLENLMLEEEIVVNEDENNSTVSMNNDTYYDTEETILQANENIDITKVHLSEKKRKLLRYAGDFSEEDLETPRKRKMFWKTYQQMIKTKNDKIKLLQQKNRSLKSQINNLNSLIDDLQSQSKLNANGSYMLKNIASDEEKHLLMRQLKLGSGKNITPELRKFALTLHYYSPSAYLYIRKIFSKALPDISTIRKWYTTINGLPGLTRESFQAISIKVNEMKNIGKQLYGCLIIDEMSIKQHVQWTGSRHQGYVDYGQGGGTDSMDNLPYAKDAFVIMVVGLNTHWKVPIAYYLVNGISAEEKSNIIKSCLHQLHETGIIIKTITFDGAANNMSMASLLGANLNYADLKPNFKHPLTDDNVHIVLDPCHMVKLIRNCLGDWGLLFDKNNKPIKWIYFKHLVDLQNVTGLHAATKIRTRHIHYHREKMKVRLATQVFSNSVSDALEYCCKDLKNKLFENAEATIEFCRRINNIFDLLNSRNFLSKSPFNKPLSENFLNLNIFIDESIDYLNGIQCLEKPPKYGKRSVLQSERKTGFLGLITCLKTIKNLYSELIETKLLQFLLTYKFNQDHIELLFGGIRAKGGFNNNPTVAQFEAAYKSIIINAEVKCPSTANALALDDTSILRISSAPPKKNDEQSEMLDLLCAAGTEIIETEDILDIYEHRNYLNDVVTYIAGFVVYKINKKILCTVCEKSLGTKESGSALIGRKNRGGLIIPNPDVIEICKIAERVIRGYQRIDGSNVIMGIFLWGYVVYSRLDTTLQEWVDALEIWQVYLGLYVLIFASIVVIIAPFLSCFAVYQELSQLLMANAGVHLFSFFVLLLGSAVLLENTTTGSGIVSSIRESMTNLIMQSQNEYATNTLNMIQESIGCCGADGPNDYLSLRKALPTECRDTVTGNAFFYGCADEVTWFLEDKSRWTTNIAISIAALEMLISVLSVILVKALQKEEKFNYNR